MNDWTFFATLYDGMITPLIMRMQGMFGMVTAQAEILVLLLIGIWMALAWFQVGHQTMTMEEFKRHLFCAIMVMAFIQVGQYTDTVAQFWITGVPTTIGNLVGNGGASPVAGLDNMLTTIIVDASKTYDGIDSWSARAIVLCLAVLAAAIGSMICLAFAFIVWALGAVTTIVCVAFGSFFMAFGAIPTTRKIASGWLAVLIGSAVTQLIALAVVSLMTPSVQALLKQFAITAADTNSNSMSMVWGLGRTALLLWMFKKLMEQAPDIGRTIGGGVYHGANSVMQSMFSAVNKTVVEPAKAAGAAVGAHASRQMGTGFVRANTPPAGSLSQRRT